MAQLWYWIADWDLSEGEAAVQLGGDVDYMVDTIGADAKPDLSFLRDSNIRKIGVYVTGSPGIIWTPGEVAAYRLAGFTVITIDQRNGPAVVANVADVESGAKTAAQAIVEAEDMLDQGRSYTIYVEKAHLGDVAAAWAKTGRELGKVVAVQWASPTSNPDTIVTGDVTLKDANVDLSVTLPDWHPVPAVKPPTPAAPLVKHAVVAYDETADGWGIRPGTQPGDLKGDLASVTWDKQAGPGWSIGPRSR